MSPGQIALTAGVVAWHAVTWPIVAILVVAAMRRGRAQPGFAVVTGALAVITVSWALTLTSAAPPPAAQYASFAALPVLLATYPDGRFVPRWLAAPTLGLAGCGVAAMVTGGAVPGESWWRVLGPATLLPLLAQVHRYRRRASTAERESVRWAVLGTLLALAGCVLLLILLGAPIDDASPAWAQAVVALTVLVMPVTLTLGLLRPRLLDVDVALRAVIAGSVLLATAGGGYWAVAGVLGMLGVVASAAGPAAGLIAAVAALAVARPAISVADRLVYRGRPDAGRAARDLGRALAGEPDPGQVPVTVLRAVVHALSLDGALLRGDGSLHAELGTLGAREFAVPVVYQDDHLADLVVAPRRGETSLTRRDIAVLQRMALHAAPALHGARALADLGEARSRVIRLRAEERKALRHDIHDDLGPTLAGLGLAAAAVAALVRERDTEAAEIADRLVRDLHAAMAQVRELTHDLRPPILDDEGLVAAIRARVERPQDELRVRVAAPAGRLALPAAVELAALRIVQEAVSNVRRHAGATTCTIRIDLIRTDQAVNGLEVTVTDDGAGLPAGLAPGIGLRSIRQRTQELGGTASFGPAPGGGTRIHVSLSCGPPPPDRAPGAAAPAEEVMA